LLIYSCSCTLTFCAVEKGEKIREKRLRPTGSLAQAGVLSRGTLRRILEAQLPSEPYRYPRLPQAAKTLGESGGQRAGLFRWTFSQLGLTTRKNIT